MAENGLQLKNEKSKADTIIIRQVNRNRGYCGSVWEQTFTKGQ